MKIDNRSILFLATSSNVNSGGGRTRMIDFSELFIKKGVKVTILSLVYASQYLHLRKLLNGRIKLSKDTGGEVWYIPLLPFGNWEYVRRINDWLILRILGILLKQRGFNNAIGLGTQAGYYLVRSNQNNTSINVAVDIQGAIIDEMLYQNKIADLDNSKKCLEFQERICLSEARKIFFVSENMKIHFTKKYPNSVASSFVLPSLSKSDIKNTVHLDSLHRKPMDCLSDKFVIGYLGSAESYQLPAVMCQLVENILIRNVNIFFLVLSYDKKIFEDELHKIKIDPNSYKIIGVPRDKVDIWTKMMDLGLLLRDDSTVNIVSSPTKFGEYLKNGVPVLLTQTVGDFSAIVDDTKIGLVVSLSEIDREVEKIISFISEIEENREQFTANCQRYFINHLNWDNFEQDVFSFVDVK